MEFYRTVKNVIEWFNAVLAQHMELYVDTVSSTFVLVEKYNCDILTTSRVYTDSRNGNRVLLPPNAWDDPIVNWNVDPSTETTYVTNACNMYSFDTFDTLITYLKTLHATKSRVPFFNINALLEEEHLARLTDVDSSPPRPKRSNRTKVYIS